MGRAGDAAGGNGHVLPKIRGQGFSCVLPSFTQSFPSKDRRSVLRTRRNRRTAPARCYQLACRDARGRRPRHQGQRASAAAHLGPRRAAICAGGRGGGGGVPRRCSRHFPCAAWGQFARGGVFEPRGLRPACHGAGDRLPSAAARLSLRRLVAAITPDGTRARSGRAGGPARGRGAHVRADVVRGRTAPRRRTDGHHCKHTRRRRRHRRSHACRALRPPAHDRGAQPFARPVGPGPGVGDGAERSARDLGKQPGRPGGTGRSPSEGLLERFAAQVEHVSSDRRAAPAVCDAWSASRLGRGACGRASWRSSWTSTGQPRGGLWVRSRSSGLVQVVPGQGRSRGDGRIHAAAPWLRHAGLIANAAGASARGDAGPEVRSGGYSGRGRSRHRGRRRTGGHGIVHFARRGLSRAGHRAA